jgi:hypothetical protein
VQAMVKHSQDKDQFLKVAVKWIQETQTFDQIETKLTEESQSKEGNLPSSFYFTNHI